LPTWAQGDVVNVPVSTDREAQRAVLRQMVRAVRFAPKGAVVRIATGSLDLGRLMRALRAAHRRGVQVRFVTANQTYSAKELALKEEIGSDRSSTSYVLSRPKAWGKFALPPTTLLVSTSGTSTRVRLDSNQRSTKEGATYLTRAKVTTNRSSYEGMMATFDGIH
jgi:hypothetical protein